MRRVRGQIEVVGRLLEKENECTEILRQIAACRGSISGLMSEVLEEDDTCLHLDDRCAEILQEVAACLDSINGLMSEALEARLPEPSQVRLGKNTLLARH